MRLTMSAVMRRGAGRPGICAVVITISMSATCACDGGGRAALLVFGLFPGVAAGGLAVCAEFRRDEGGAEALHLFARRRRGHRTR